MQEVLDDVSNHYVADPTDGSLYVHSTWGSTGSSDRVRKLSLSIADLVAVSPYRTHEVLQSGDGEKLEVETLFAGSKRDTWLLVNADTGRVEHVLDSPGSACPTPTPASGSGSGELPAGAPRSLLLIGRSEYSLGAFDTKDARGAPRTRWRTRFHDYAANALTDDFIRNYEFVHATSSSGGVLYTFEKSSGRKLWTQDLGAAIVGIYQVWFGPENDEDPVARRPLPTNYLVKVPFTPLASDTLNRLVSSGSLLDQFIAMMRAPDEPDAESDSNQTRESTLRLTPSLYIGTYNTTLYAMPALVDAEALLVLAPNALPSPPSTSASWPPPPPSLANSPPATPQPLAQHALPAGFYELDKIELLEEPDANNYCSATGNAGACVAAASAGGSYSSLAALSNRVRLLGWLADASGQHAQQPQPQLPPLQSIVRQFVSDRTLADSSDHCGLPPNTSRVHMPCSVNGTCDKRKHKAAASREVCDASPSASASVSQTPDAELCAASGQQSPDSEQSSSNGMAVSSEAPAHASASASGNQNQNEGNGGRRKDPLAGASGVLWWEREFDEGKRNSGTGPDRKSSPSSSDSQLAEEIVSTAVHYLDLKLTYTLLFFVLTIALLFWIFSKRTEANVRAMLEEMGRQQQQMSSTSSVSVLQPILAEVALASPTDSQQQNSHSHSSSRGASPAPAAAAAVGDAPAGDRARQDSRSQRERAAEATAGNESMVRVGKLQYEAAEAGIIGRGCEGTVVYRGVFDGRPAAVKRIPNVCIGADGERGGGVRRATIRELQLLRSMNVQHSNLLRYYCMEEDSDFTYLGLELCLCTLQQLVEQRALGLHLEGIERPPEACTPHALQIQAAARFFTDTQLFEQLLEGLVYLHSLSIAHRDLKPQNVMVTRADARGQYRVVLGDFGFSKQLRTSVSSPAIASDEVSASATDAACGTEGWIAPELKHAERKLTQAADVFAVGCLFYYTLTGGLHPFDSPQTQQRFVQYLESERARIGAHGAASAPVPRPPLNSPERQANIMANHVCLEFMYRESHTNLLSLDAIGRALDGRPESRPTAAQLLGHPMFWSKQHQLQFLQDVSDRIEKLAAPTSSPTKDPTTRALENGLDEQDAALLQAIERDARTTLGGDWRAHISPQLQVDLRKFRNYRGDLVRDLVRAIRNKKHHYRELSPELQRSLGAPPDDFLDYFTSRFPRLITHLYLVIERHCRLESLFAHYFNAA